MTGTAVLLFLIGLFIIVNAHNFTGVFNGDKSISVFKTPTTDKVAKPDLPIDQRHG